MTIDRMPGGAAAPHRRARRPARAAFGAGAITAAGLAGAIWVGLVHQIRSTSSLIDAAAMVAGFGRVAPSPDARSALQAVPGVGDGVYLPDGTGPWTDAPTGTAVLAMLGDSTAVGYGCATADELPGVCLARGAAAALRRPVRIATLAVIGSGAVDLPRQIAAVREKPDVVVIMIGSNDVRDRIPPRRAATQLGRAVATLSTQHVAAVVGTCPDLGVITSIPLPLRRIVAVWSRVLARMQERSVTGAGGVAVPIARLVSPEFYGHPELFCADGFHPSGPGYAKAVAAVLPEVIAALR